MTETQTKLPCQPRAQATLDEKTYLPQIESDLALVKELLATYDRNKTK